MSTPRVPAATRVASVRSSPRSCVCSANRPSSATAACWRRGGRAVLGVHPLGDVAHDDERGLDRTVHPCAIGHRLDRERQPFAGELERPPLARAARAIAVDRELEHVVGDLGVELRHLAAAEHVLVGPGQPPDRLAVGEEDPQVVVDEEHAGVRQVRRQRPAQRLGLAGLKVGLLARARHGSLEGVVAENDEAASTARQRHSPARVADRQRRAVLAREVTVGRRVVAAGAHGDRQRELARPAVVLQRRRAVAAVELTVVVAEQSEGRGIGMDEMPF